MVEDKARQYTNLIPRVLRSRLTPLKRITQCFQTLQQVPISDNPFATHLPVLVGLPRLFKIKRVVELGCGKYSTPTFLETSIFPDLQFLHSFETDEHWGAEIMRTVGGDGRFSLTLTDKSMSAAIADINFEECDLIFIDDSALVEEREETIRKVAGACDDSNVLVIHDYENKNYVKASEDFPNRFTFNGLNPNTGIVWRTTSIKRQRLNKLHKLIKRYSKNVAPSDVNRWFQIFETHSV